jgi:hypothetical protein
LASVRRLSSTQRPYHSRPLPRSSYSWLFPPAIRLSFVYRHQQPPQVDILAPG